MDKKKVVTKAKAKKVLEIVDCGLSSGMGKPIPGEMCVEAAVCFAFGEPHGDKPTCVSPVLRSLKISLNDKNWSSKEARAKGLRRIAIAQLGTSENFDERVFRAKVIQLLKTKTIPGAFRSAASVQKTDELRDQLLNAATELENSTLEALEAIRAARDVANKVRNAAYAADAAAYAADAAAYAADAAAYAADAAAYAAANISKAATRDEKLAEFAEQIVQILIEMNTPGSKFLFLTEKN